VQDTVSRLLSVTESELVLRFVQPGLVGLIDGTVSTLAPIFAAALLAGSHAALLVGLATAIGAAISMGLSEALSDDGTISGRGPAAVRGLTTGGATFFGGAFHALPFLIPNIQQALIIASIVVAFELVAIAFIRKRFMRVSLSYSLVQVTLGGGLVAFVGYAIGHG
jgi:VIT1/CCC1 family predicted Fe2+/Mn2+ transporter